MSHGQFFYMWYRKNIYVYIRYRQIVYIIYRQYIQIWCRQKKIYFTRVTLLHCVILPMHSYITIIHFKTFNKILTINIPPHSFPQSLLQRCLIIIFFFFFLLAFFLLFSFLFLFRLFFCFFIFTTPILFFIHTMTKILHQFYMGIIHVIIPSTEPFVPLDKCLCAHCS